MKTQSLRINFELLQMEKNELVVAYASKIQGLMHIMKSYGEVMTKKTIIEKVIRTFNIHFDHVIFDIQESSTLTTMKMEDLAGSLETHELGILERSGVMLDV